MLDMQQKQEYADTMTLQEGYGYLLEKWPDLKFDTLYHRIVRGKGVPHEKRDVPRGSKYLVRRQALDELEFYRQKEEGAPRQKTIRHPEIVPVPVHTAADLHQLTEKFGPLVDDDGLLNYLEEKYGYRYSRGSIKQRRRRGTIVCVGYSRSHQHWYAIRYLDELNFRPELASKQKERQLTT